MNYNRYFKTQIVANIGATVGQENTKLCVTHTCQLEVISDLFVSCFRVCWLRAVPRCAGVRRGKGSGKCGHA